MILIDTNVLSEALKPTPSARVIEWLDTNFSECALSSIVLFEMKAGIALLGRGKRRDTLQRAMDLLVPRFGSRLYTFDARAADSAARLLSVAKEKGLPLHQSAKLADLQMAGIAHAYALQLATRNTRDFRGLNIDLVDPWSA